MAAVEALQYQVVLSRSDDLKTWTHLSDFGPANATGGIWECPDLFPLAVDGDPANTKWVLVVNLNPGQRRGRLRRPVLRGRLRRHDLHVGEHGGG